MKLGTKSVLFGAHQFLIHPFFVATAWWKLYGFPCDPRLWVLFFVHDLGYFGKPNMDGPEGERHVEFGARLMHLLFDHPRSSMYWHDLSLYHSRFYAKNDGRNPSKLCPADKLAVALEPWWLYLPRVIASGEINEYMAKAGGMPNSKYAGEPNVGKYKSMNIVSNDPQMSLWAKRRYWFAKMNDYLRKWVAEHKDGRPDSWTPPSRQSIDNSGVWK